MNLVIGGDHAGYALKEVLKKKLTADGHNVIDTGAFSPDPVDFPDVSVALCQPILDGRAERGIICCGSGVGAAICCNKVKGIRAITVHDVYTAHQCVEHDDVQVMAIGELIVGRTVAFELTDIFLNARVSCDPDIQRRIKKMNEI